VGLTQLIDPRRARDAPEHRRDGIAYPEELAPPCRESRE